MEFLGLRLYGFEVFLLPPGEKGAGDFSPRAAIRAFAASRLAAFSASNFSEASCFSAAFSTSTLPRNASSLAAVTAPLPPSKLRDVRLVLALLLGESAPIGCLRADEVGVVA